MYTGEKIVPIKVCLSLNDGSLVAQALGQQFIFVIEIDSPFICFILHSLIFE